MGQRNQIAKQTFKDIPQEFQMHYSGVVDSVNTLLGYSGTIPMQNNLDVQGNNVQNVANPVAPTDALNLQTAESKYSPTVVGPQLDVGGTSSLKGVNALYLWKNSGLSVTITTAKLTSGGTEGSMTFVAGLLVKQVQAT